MPSNAAASARRTQQKRVDVIQAITREGNFPHHRSNRPAPTPCIQSENPLDVLLAEELQYAKRLLEAVGEELVSDPALVASHSQALQDFDVVSQLLGHFAAVIASANRDDAINRIGIQDLRARLKQYK